MTAKVKHLDLFSGIGGFALAARWMGWETVQFVEIDKFCQKVLKKNFPDIPIHDDIKTFDASPYAGTIDVVSGGFPCQPFSQIGKRIGVDDNRYLWPEMFAVCSLIRPCWIIGENVPGIRKMALDQVCTSLENIGYTVEAISIPASAIGCWQRRERIFIIANIDRPCMERFTRDEHTREKRADEIGRTGPCYWARNWKEVATEFCRNNARIPHRMDRIKSLGNSIVPQVAYEIFQAIETVDPFP